MWHSYTELDTCYVFIKLMTIKYITWDFSLSIYLRLSANPSGNTGLVQVLEGEDGPGIGAVNIIGLVTNI